MGALVGAVSPSIRPVMLVVRASSSTTKNNPPRPFWLLERIAATLDCEEADVMAALGMLGLPLPGERQVPQVRPVVDVDRVPKKWQDHYGPERR